VLKHFNSWQLRRRRPFPSWLLAYSRSQSSPARAGGRRACVPGRERFFHFLFNAKSFHKCCCTSTPGNCATGVPSLLAFGLPEVSEFACSGEDRRSRFGECLQHDYSLLFVFVFLGTTTVRDWSCGKEDRHCYLSALHRARRLHRQVLC
jgi:hypothetical protein